MPKTPLWLKMMTEKKGLFVKEFYSKYCEKKCIRKRSLWAVFWQHYQNYTFSTHETRCYLTKSIESKQLYTFIGLNCCILSFSPSYISNRNRGYPLTLIRQIFVTERDFSILWKVSTPQLLMWAKLIFLARTPSRLKFLC